MAKLKTGKEITSEVQCKANLKSIGDALYAIGGSLHAQVSTVVVLPQSRWWEGASFAAEIAANERLDISRNPGAFDTSRSRGAVSMRVAFEPLFRESEFKLAMEYGEQARELVR